MFMQRITRLLALAGEKDHVDCLYLASRKGRRFGNLPELELGRAFRKRRARERIRRIPDSRIRMHASHRLEDLLPAA